MATNAGPPSDGRKAGALDFAGLLLPDALRYFWQLLAAAILESETFGRDRFVLRARAHRRRTESGETDHCRFSATQSGGVGLYHLRVIGMASAEREIEKSRVRGVAAEGVAAAGSSRFAGVARHQTTRSSSPPGHRSAE